MIKNYFKVSLRNLWKNKGFSAINIFGLATGIACSLLIFLFVKDETGYDRFHKDADNIYRVVKNFVNDDGCLIPDATTPAPLAPAMQNEIPEVVSITSVRPNWGNSYVIKHGDKKFAEDKIYGVDSSFFDVFTFPFIEGSSKNAFRDMKSVVLTETVAKKIFGHAYRNVLGKTMNIDAFGDMLVSGVMKDVPSNAHFHFDYLVSYRKQPGETRQLTNWNNYNDYTYVKTKPRTNIPAFVKKIQALNDHNVEKSYSRFYVQPTKDIYLTSNLKWELAPNDDKQYVYIFTLIALFIILIAGINYMNLSTVKASVRAKEIGVRKVAGALRSSLINQFLIESVITCLIASIVAMAIAQFLLPVVNTITGKQLSLFQGPALLYAIADSLLLGIIAGFFPALYLSSFAGAIAIAIAIAIAFFTISFQTIKAAIANPVKNLRSE